MATLAEQSVWSPVVYQLEYNDLVVGGTPEFNGSVPSGGYANVAAQQLANRTQFLLSRVTTTDLSLGSVQDQANATQTRAEQHYGSVGINEHGLATQAAPGFMSDADKQKVDNLKVVAFSNSYQDLDYKPPIEYTLRTIDFEALVGYRYYISSSVQVTLGDPKTYNYVAGNFITLNKSPDISPNIVTTGTVQMVTATGNTQSVSYDVDDEIIFVFDGTNWRI